MLRGQTPRHCGDLVYAYPPLFALFWIPLAILPVWLRVLVWYLVTLGAIFSCLRVCETLARRSFPSQWSQGELITLRVLTFAFSSKFILAVLENQAYDSIALIFVLLGLLGLISRRWLLGAVSLGAAAALKVTPLIFLPYLFFKKRFAAAGVFVSALVVLSLLPDIFIPPKEQWHVTVWLRDVILAPLTVKPGFDMPFWVTDSPMNQTFRAAVMRLFTGVHQQQSLEVVFAIMQSRSFAIALYSVMGLYAFIVGCVMLKSRHNDQLIAVDGGLLIVSALLLTPVSSQSHFVALMLPYALLSAALIKDKPRRVFNWVMLLVSFILATATSNDLVGRSFTGWALWNSLPVFGTLILIIPLTGLVRSINKSRAPNPEPLDVDRALAR